MNALQAKANFPHNEPMRFLRESECHRMTGMSRTQRWRLERSGDFPRRVPIGAKAHGWLEHEVQDWIRRRAAERDRNIRDRDRSLLASMQVGAQ